MQGLLQTEMTDAVNSGLVDNADKSGSTLKGAAAVYKSAKDGMSNAALAAITDNGKTKEGSGKGSDAATSVDEDGLVDTAVSSRQSLRSGLKRSAKGAAGAMVVGKALEGSELEGADDLYYKGKTIKWLVSRARSRMGDTKGKSKRSVSLHGRDTAVSDKPLGSLSEKGTARKSVDPLTKKRKAQAAGYIKRTIYSTSTATKTATLTSAKAAKGLITTAGGGLKGVIAALSGVPMLIVVGLLFLVLLLSSLAGAAGGAAGANESSSASLNATENQVAMFFMGKGLDALHTSAIMGNMYAESGMIPSKIENGGTGIGICQWSNGRANNLRRYAAQQGKSWEDLSVQLDFFWDHDEWSQEWGDDVHNKSNFLASNDLNDAVEQFCWGWERPRASTAHLDTRKEAAQRYYTALTTGAAGGGQDYASAEQWQKNIVDACYRVPWPGKSKCATWTHDVYEAAGYPNVGGNGNSQLGNQGYGANYYPSRATTDLSQVQVGMLISAQYGSDTTAGNKYGHVCIYIGDGKVMDSVTSGVRTVSLSDWVSAFSRGWVVCGYPWDWR